MQLTKTIYDVAVDGRVIKSFESHADASEFRAANPGAQLRTRSATTTVPAAFAVFVNGEQIGDPHSDPGAAAKAAKQCGGMIKMVPAQS